MKTSDCATSLWMICCPFSETNVDGHAAFVAVDHFPDIVERAGRTPALVHREIAPVPVAVHGMLDMDHLRTEIRQGCRWPRAPRCAARSPRS